MINPRKHYKKQEKIFNVFILILFFNLFPNLSFSQQLFEKIQNDLTIDFIFTEKLNTTEKGELKSLTAKFIFIPHEDNRQHINSIEYFSNPKTEFFDQSKNIFKWNELHNEYTIGYHAKITNRFYPFQVVSSPFPLLQTSDSLKKYVRFDALINQNHNIDKKAKLLTAGETELFAAAFNIGLWIYENIEYRKTGYQEVEPATAVFRTKFGDCDEMSVLFLSMLRSVNIPCRLVSGIAHGSIGFDFHSWTEIFFENTGWIPFDVTFAQFGNIDQSHIKLNHYHSNSNMLSHVWEYLPFFGDLEIEAEGLPKIEANIVQSKRVSSDIFDTKLFTYKNHVESNSFVPVIVTTQNKTPFFISNKLFIAENENVKIMGDSEYILDYFPYESKEIKFLVKLDEALKEDFSLLVNLKASDQFGSSDSSNVIFNRYGFKIDQEMANSIIQII